MCVFLVRLVSIWKEIDCFFLLRFLQLLVSVKRGIEFVSVRAFVEVC